MGGFAGGDEGGYWDIESTQVKKNYKSKSTKKKKLYTESSDSLYSIRVYVKDTYSTISFIPCRCETFTVKGCDDIPLELNTLYKLYQELNDYTCDSDISDFFLEHKVVVEKCIELDSSTARSASHVGAFLCLIKEACNLLLSTEELVKIGSSIDSNVAFFIHDYASKN